MKNTKIILITSLIIAWLILPQAAQAATYYLDSSVASGGDGKTLATAFKTIVGAQAALNSLPNAGRGSTVIIMNGNYAGFSESPDIDRSGGEGWLTYRAGRATDLGINGDQTNVVFEKINPSGDWTQQRSVFIGYLNKGFHDKYLRFEGIKFKDTIEVTSANYVEIINSTITKPSFADTQAAAIHGRDAHHIKIENNTISHAYRGITVGGNYWVIKDNDIHEIAEDGMQGGGSNALIEGNEIWDIDPRNAEGDIADVWQIHPDGIQWYTDTGSPENVTFRGNNIHTGEMQGLFLTFTGGKNIIVENNLIHDINTNSAYLNAGTVGDLYLYNNTVIRKPGIGGSTVRLNGAVEAYNNIFSVMWLESGTINSQGNNLFAGASIFSPNDVSLSQQEFKNMFVSYDGWDYHPKTGQTFANIGGQQVDPCTMSSSGSHVGALSCSGVQFVCGNGIIETGEQCDNGSANTNSPNLNCYGQIAYCNTSCSSRTANCNRYCGNNTIESTDGEACDGTNLGNQTCQSQGYTSGTLTCTANCQSFNTSGCATTNIYYVRAGATGNGSDWGNAAATLPSALTRGKAYYIADGTYPAYTFDDASGTMPITIKKATKADHGTGIGWQDSFGDGIAQFGAISFNNTSNIFLDGQEGKGIKIAANSGSVVNISGSDYITVENCDIDGLVNACTGVNMSSGNNVTIKGCNIHDIADDGFQVGNGDNLSIINNTVYKLYGCGTDGGCGPCYNGHSDGIEIYNIHNCEIRGNLIYDVRSTSAFFPGNWSGATSNKNFTIANNIFYTPESGFTMYVHYIDGIKIYNNTIWQGVFGGIAMGQNVTNMEIYNNIIHSINYSHSGVPFDAVHHKESHNLIADITGQGFSNPDPTDIITIDPRFENMHQIQDAISSGGWHIDPAYVKRNISKEDFRLLSGSPAIDAGTNTNLTEDIFGNPRPQGNGYDLGAYEYQDSATTCTGSDASCGIYPNCQNCNQSDGCSGTQYRDYKCSGTSCTYTADNCTDCSCNCSGYNANESLANNNCSDTKDNDCDGTTDAQDIGCNASSYLVNIDFENGNNGLWANYNPGNGTPTWSIINDSSNGGTNARQLSGTINALSNQERLGAYSIIQGAQANDFTAEASIRSTASSTWRDLAIVFSYQNDNNYCMALFNKSCDQYTNGIFAVSNGTKQKISTQACSCADNCGTLKDNTYHNTKIVKQNNSVQVFFDNMLTAVFMATNAGCGTGSFGFGSINDTGLIDNIAITTACTTAALLSYINQWKTGQVTMPILMQKIAAWKAGTGC